MFRMWYQDSRAAIICIQSGFYTSSAYDHYSRVSICMGICSYFRGRLNFHEMLNVEVRTVQTLRYIIQEEMKNEDNTKYKAAEIVEDELIGG